MTYAKEAEAQLNCCQTYFYYQFHNSIKFSDIYAPCIPIRLSFLLCSQFCSADKNRKLPSNATKYAKGQQKERLHATKVLQNELKSKYDELQDVSGYEVEQQQQQQQGANVRNAKSNEENSSSEQQPDIIPYPLGVGEISWKKEKRQRKEKEEAADQGQQWQQRT